MGAIFCIPHRPTLGQIKTPVQCVENPKGLDGVIIYNQMLFPMNKQHLVAVCDHTEDSYNSTNKQNLPFEGKSSVRPVLL